MTIARVLISWMAAGFWLVGGLLLLAAGYFLAAFVVAGLVSIAIALLVAVVPLRPIAALSVGTAIVYCGLAALLTAIEPNVLSVAAGLAYLAAAFFSLGVFRRTPTEAGPHP